MTRTAPGIDGPVILGAWCPTCRQESLPMRDGTCGWCDTQIVDVILWTPPEPVAVVRVPKVRQPNIPTATLVTALQAAAAELGRAPTSYEWAARSPSRRTLYHRFGSWSAALDAAGLA